MSLDQHRRVKIATMIAAERTERAQCNPNRQKRTNGEQRDDLREVISNSLPGCRAYESNEQSPIRLSLSS